MMLQHLSIQHNILEPPTHNKIGYNENDATTPLHTTQHFGNFHIQQNWLQRKWCYNTSTYQPQLNQWKHRKEQIKHLTTWQTNNDIQHNILEPPPYNRIGYNDNNATTPLHTVQHFWNLPHATKLAAAKWLPLNLLLHNRIRLQQVSVFYMTVLLSG